MRKKKERKAKKAEKKGTEVSKHRERKEKR